MTVVLTPCRRRSASEPFEDFDPAFERAKFARGKLLKPRFKPDIPGYGGFELAAAAVRQAQRQAASIVRIRLPRDLACAHQRLNRTADRGRAALDLGGDLIERCRLERRDRAEQVALLPHSAGVSDVAAQLLDQSGKARCDRGR